MDTINLIPNYQSLPMPAPTWLLELLLVIGFFLHAIPMNLAVGGSLMSATLIGVGKFKNSAKTYKIGRQLAFALPIFISFAITQGIVPLLFIQLLYGPMFYSSSVIMAVPWISILFILLISYYITYLVTYKFLNKIQNDNLSKISLKGPIFLLIAFIGFAIIAFIFSNNTTLMLTPQKWLSLYRHSPSGFNLNLSEPQLIPRYLHFIFATLAVTSLAVSCFGAFSKDNTSDYAKFTIKLGSKLFLFFTLFQIPIGVWFLMSLPKEYMLNFMGHDKISTIFFALSMILTLISLLSSAITSITASYKIFIVQLISSLVLVLSMIINRHELRSFYLNKIIHPELLTVNMQWDLIIIFTLTATGLIIYFYWLSNVVWNAFHNPIKKI